MLVTLSDGRTVSGSHALTMVGSVPNTGDLGLEKVGISQNAIDSGEVPGPDRDAAAVDEPAGQDARVAPPVREAVLPAASGVMIGGVVVAPVASELILSIAMVVQNGLNVDDLGHTFSVYPSLSGSITEAGRRLRQRSDLD